MPDTSELHLSKSAMSTVDPTVLKTWQEYIRVTDEEIASIRRSKTWLLIVIGSLCLALGLLVGWMFGRGILSL